MLGEDSTRMKCQLKKQHYLAYPPLLWWLILIMTTIHYTSSVAAFSIQFRSATSQDVFEARKILFKEAMNPLSISEQTLFVAYNYDGSDDNNNKNDSSSSLIGFGQIRNLEGNNNYSELASLYVKPEYRHQGIGSALVQQLLSKHDNDANAYSRSICLLTLKPTIDFYTPFGFVTVNKEDMKQHYDLPTSFLLEYQAGTIISAMLGNDLVCMIRSSSS